MGTGNIAGRKHLFTGGCVNPAMVPVPIFEKGAWGIYPLFALAHIHFNG
jgi:hypothetical protein